jgi:hypothetical protein
MVPVNVIDCSMIPTELALGQAVVVERRERDAAGIGREEPSFEHSMKRRFVRGSEPTAMGAVVR